MTPKASTWGWLTSEGRLRNQWAQALEQPSEELVLAGLREVQQRLQAKPDRFVHLWESFLDAFFDARRVALLTENDLASVEQMGATLAQLHQTPLRPGQVWARILAARDVRNERRAANELLTRIYQSPATEAKEKAQHARELARRGASGDAQIAVYIQHLNTASAAAQETEVAGLLANLCAVDFTSERLRLKRAGEVARRIVDSGIQVNGLQRALGLFFLLIEQAAPQAAKHFSAAAKADPQDKTALIGWLAAAARSGDYGVAEAVATQVARFNDPLVTGLHRLNAALAWLDLHHLNGPAPCRAADLEGADLTTYAGDALPAVLGRLHLFEGDARRAAQCLAPLAQHPDPQWRCYHQWATALTETDTARSLEGLRQVCQYLGAHPDQSAHVWLRFIEAFLDSARVATLAEEDLRAVEEMGAALSPLAALRPEQVWLRLIAARDARGEQRPACALLTRIYQSPSASAELKAQCAHELARRGASGDAQINVYVEHLSGVAQPNSEPDMVKLLAAICAVDFESDRLRLKRAGEVARKLSERKIPIPGLHRALGLYRLLIEPDPAAASTHFEAAFRAGEEDRVALIGLLATRIQRGEHQLSEKVVTCANRLSDPVAAGLLRLNETLVWLNRHDLAGPPPCNVQEMESLGLEKYAGDALNLALGRLCLLEGDAPRAVRLLAPLADRHADQPRWHYHAAWAEALSGDVNRVNRRFAELPQWSGRWTLACLVADLDPAQAEKSGALGQLKQAPKPFAKIAQARLGLIHCDPPAAVEWEPKAGALEEDLEALRTKLGLAVWTRNDQVMERALALPLFNRLPLADQLLWRGLHALLSGDASAAHVLLERATLRFGHQRAALLLAVHLLEHGQAQEAKEFLERGSAGRRDAKIELLRLYFQALEGQLNAATERLEEMSARGNRRASYALGNLYLQRAEQARKAGAAEQVKLFRAQAAGAFNAAAGSSKEAPPVDCEALARCAELLSDPERTITAWAGLWDEVERLGAERRQPWVVWHALLAQIWSGSSATLGAPCEHALTLLEAVDSLEPRAAAAIAQTVARACLDMPQPEQVESLVKLLAKLAAGADKRVKRFHQLGMTALARLHYARASDGQRTQAIQRVLEIASADRDNIYLALLQLQAGLEGMGGLDDAAAALRQAQPAERFEQSLCNTLSDLLNGQAPALERLPQPESGSAPETVQANHLLRAATAFVAGKPETGYDAVLAAMRGPREDIRTIVEISRFLPALCASSTKGKTPPPALVEAVRKLSKGAAGAQAVVVAQCLAAIGEVDLACRLWEQALAREQAPNSSTREDYVKLLRHLAVKAREQGNDLEAIRRLRQAADASV